MRVALCDDSSLAFWTDGSHLFTPLVEPLRTKGHEVVLLDAPSCGLPRLVTAFARERDALPLLSSTRIAHRLIADPPDLCLFRENTGLAHAALMARACGELPSTTRIVLWREAEDASQDGAGGLDEGWSSGGLRSVVTAAMRRYCAEACDGVIPATEPRSAGLLGEGAFEASIVLRDLDESNRDFAFCGPLTRHGGLVAFIEAFEALARRNAGSVGKVTFIGDFVDDGGGGVDREWLGRRASGWSFRFSVKTTRSFTDASAQVARHGGGVVLAVGLGADAVTRLVDGRRRPTSVRRLSRRDRHDPATLREMFETPSHGHEQFSGKAACDTLLACADGAGGTPAPAPVPVGLSVCILHHERPKLLAQALASVLSQATDNIALEVLIVDNASTSAEAAAALGAAAEDRRVAVIPLPTQQPYSSALNVAAERATLPFLVFLDDDNLLAPGGLARLARACAGGRFDVVTSALDLFEDDFRAPVTRTTFIGPAHTAGLFANAFGDNCMAFRREAFAGIGGYLRRDAAYPSADWILLCRAQAAGLRIGVLQQPAFLYRRSLHKSDTHWQPWDRQMVRTMLLEHYGACFDPVAVARLAQAMAMELGVS